MNVITDIAKTNPALSKFYAEKDVLILGGMGFMGSTTAHHLIRMGARVTLYDAMLPQYGGNKANVRGITDKLKVVEGDVRDFDLLKENIKEKDVVINYSAQVSHIDSMKDPYLDIDINCKGNMNVLEAVRRFNDSARVIICSTRSQIGRMEYDPVDEKHPEFPTDIYSANKSAAEKYHLIYSGAYDIFTSSLRITNVYGPRAQVKSSGYGIVNYFIRLALEGKNITVFEPGMQKRDVLYVDDAVAAMLLAGASKKAKAQVFNVASGKTHPLLEIVKQIVNVAGKGSWSMVPWPENRKRIEVGDVSMSISKIAGTLEWRPTIELDEGLHRSVEYYREFINEYV